MTWDFPKTCFQGRLGDSLRTSWAGLESTFQESPLDVRLGRPLNVISRQPQDLRLGNPCDIRLGRSWDGPIGSLRDVLRTLEGGVLGTSWGTIFAGWVVMMFLFPVNILVSFGICSILKLSKYIILLPFRYKIVQRVPIDLHSLRSITYAPSFILVKLFVE